MKKLIAVAVVICLAAWIQAAASPESDFHQIVPYADIEPREVLARVADDAGNVWIVLFDDRNGDGNYDPRGGDITLQVRQIAWGNGR